MANSRRACSRSARFSTALTSVPATKPPCTAIVSHAVCPGLSLNSRTSAGVTAVAENHSVMPRNSPEASRASIAHGEADRRPTDMSRP